MGSRVSAKSVASQTAPVNSTRRIPGWAWVLVPILAAAFAIATTTLRIQRVRYVSGLAGWSATASQGGSAASQPQLVVPGNQDSSFEWLDQTRLMLVTGQLRIRHVDYENAPFGHDVRHPSPYRWWLGALAWAFHKVSGQPLGASLEMASLLADPFLYALLLAGTAGFVAWRFGRAAAAVGAAALAALYPLAVDFLPGAPDDQGLCLMAVLWSILPILAGQASKAHRKHWFLAAGVAGGIGLWLGVVSQVPVIVGIGLGGLLAAWVARRDGLQDGPDVLPWKTWAGGGAAVTLLAYLCEYFPSYLGSWDVRAVHPLEGIAWLGWGQLVATLALLLLGGRPASRAREASLSLLALAAIASLPAAVWFTRARGFISTDISTLKLTRLPGGAASQNLLTLVIHEGFSPLVLGTILPALLAFPAIWILMRRAPGSASRRAVAVALGPVVVALGIALFRLSWWSVFDAVLVGLLAAETAALHVGEAPRLMRSAWLVLLAVLLIPGASQAWPRVGTEDKNALLESEVIGLIERDLSRWLAGHASPGGDIVLAPPKATTALYYYGGLRCLATLDLENQEGIQAAVRMVSATSFDEALDLFGRRNVTWVVIPSWDTQLDTFAQLGLGQIERSFINSLHHWSLPPWLRPVAYPLPAIGGFEGQSVVIMKVTEDQDDALLMSRIAEYMIETGNLGLAGSAGNALRRFQADLGALVARAQVAVARGENDEFMRVLASLLSRLSGEGERALPWDRRVSLAVVLAQGQHLDRARDQLRKCLAEVNEEKLRSLTTGSLYHFEVLERVLGMEISDPALRQLALNLLPPEMAKRFEK
jgi:hypothetical protein